MDNPLSLIRKFVKRSKTPGIGPSPCPDEENFATYLAGNLAEIEKVRFEVHLSECDKCLEDLLMVSRSLESNDPASGEFVNPGMLKEAKNLISPKHHPDSRREAFSRLRFHGPIRIAIACGLALVFAVLVIHGLHAPKEHFTKPDVGIDLWLTAGAPLEAHSPDSASSMKEIDIRDGEILKSRKKIRVQFQLRVEAYVYLILIRPGGKLKMLIPGRQAEGHVKIEAGRTRFFPEEGWLDFSGNPGKTTFHLIASRRPIDNLHHKIQLIRKFGADRLRIAFDSITVRSFSFIQN